MWVNCTFKGGREVRITTRISESRPDLETLFILKKINKKNGQPRTAVSVITDSDASGR